MYNCSFYCLEFKNYWQCVGRRDDKDVQEYKKFAKEVSANFLFNI